MSHLFTVIYAFSVVIELCSTWYTDTNFVLPEPMTETLDAYSNDTLYIIGGEIGTSTEIGDHILIYDSTEYPASFKRINISLPAALHCGMRCAVYLNEIVYVFPNTRLPFGTIWQFDTKSYTFLTNTMSTMPYPIYASCLSVDTINSVIYLIGGKQQCSACDQPDSWKTAVPTNHLQILNVTSNIWFDSSLLEPAPMVLSLSACEYYDDKLFSFGGDSVDNEVYDYIYKYDIRNNIWSKKIDTLALPRRAHRSVLSVVNEMIYIIGGSTGTQSVKEVEVFDPNTETMQPVYTPILFVRSSFGVAELQNRLYIFGGQAEADDIVTKLDAIEISNLISLNPTSSPTANPSQSTKHPTLYPSIHPTQPPTTDPTDVPTVFPTKTPTVNPSQIPTDSPTIDPTSHPTIIPTSPPTIDPSLAPSIAPTSAPSVSPTQSPTLAPTLSPTLAPTPLCPTLMITVLDAIGYDDNDFNGLYTFIHDKHSFDRPGWKTNDGKRIYYVGSTWLIQSKDHSLLSHVSNGYYPPESDTDAIWKHSSVSGTYHVYIKCIGTYAPISAPTSSPTQTPSTAPMFSPSQTPTFNPTHSPTSSPTQTPSTTPMFSPSQTPTFNPTQSPTIPPTKMPSIVPSNNPTEIPTVNTTSDFISSLMDTGFVIIDGTSNKSDDVKIVLSALLGLIGLVLIIAAIRIFQHKHKHRYQRVELTGNKNETHI